jgi:hypothetical protein
MNSNRFMHVSFSFSHDDFFFFPVCKKCFNVLSYLLAKKTTYKLQTFRDFYPNWGLQLEK